MTTKTLLSLATVALLAAQATKYSFESTSNWFNAPVDITVDTAINNPNQVDISLDSLATLNPTSIRITGAITNLIRNATTPANTVFDDSAKGLPQAAITATSSGWCVWHCTDTEEGEWVELRGLAAPAENGDYLVNIEFKDGYVRYGIGAEPTWDPNGSDGWITNAMNFAQITKVGFGGYGTFTNYCGLAVKTVTIDTTELPEGMTIVDADDLNNSAGNGLTKKQTIQLGLPNVTTKPFTAPVQTTDDDTIGFTIGNVVGEKVQGYVTYTVEEYSDPACTASTHNTSAETDAGAQATMAVPNGVRYYKIKLNFK